MKTKVKKHNYSVHIRCGTEDDWPFNEKACQEVAEQARKIPGVFWCNVEFEKEIVCALCDWPIENGHCMSPHCAQYRHNK
jgi:hypothetical protein